MDMHARSELHACLPAVRAALAIAEDDDALFFRAQRVVRRPLLAVGRALAAAGALADPALIFELAVEETQRLRDRATDAAALVGRAVDARRRREAARRQAPPAAVRGGVPTWRGGAAGGAGVLRGAATGGRGFGRALLVDPAAAGGLPGALPAGAVLVAQAILPSLTYLLPGAAGLVTDHGGALSHAATLAREYGVPAVLGTGVATRVLRGGEVLVVDGDAGKVYRLGGG
jgi:pyruvate,water dikinase